MKSMTEEDKAIKISQACRLVNEISKREEKLRAESVRRQTRECQEACKNIGIDYFLIKRRTK